MRLRDLMTTDVLTVGPEAPLKEAARRMVEAGVSGLAVTDANRALVGIITEADFVKNEADRRAKKRARLLRLFSNEPGIPKSQRRVSDVMTSGVITLGPDADHAEAARVMEGHGIKRIPVVDGDGELVGLVSRADILKAFVRPDAEIIDEINKRVMRYILWIDPSRVDVACEDGNVVLVGHLENRSDAELLAEFTRRVDGVASVDDRLTYEFDNTKMKVATPPLMGFSPYRR